MLGTNWYVSQLCNLGVEPRTQMGCRPRMALICTAGGREGGVSVDSS